jgi:predicted dehydrogenase
MDKRLMLIGAGHLAGARAGCFARLDGVTISAVVARREEAAREFALRQGIPLAGTDVNRVADQCNPDAVAIFTHNNSHFEYVRWALKRGLHVFVDGPLCRTSAEAEELSNLSIQTQRVLEVGFQRRYHPVIQRARQMVDSGQFGQLIHGEVEFIWHMQTPPEGPAPWYLSEEISGGMPVSHMSYGLNTLRYLLGDPAEVFAAGNNFRHLQRGQVKHDTLLATLLYHHGGVAHILGSYSRPPGFPTGDLKAIGTNGAFTLQILDAPHGQFWVGEECETFGPLPEGSDYGDQHDMLAQCEAFVAAVQGRPEGLLNPPLDSWRELRTLEGVQLSATLLRTVAVP